MDIKLWESKPPFYNEQYQTEDNLGTATITAYLADLSKPHGAVVICPGGGYTHRADHEGGNVAQWLNSLGISAFVLNYRVAPYRHPTEITDAKRAIKYVRYNSKKYNILPDKIGIMGFSSGGHLAGSAAEHFDEFENIADDIDKVSARPNILCLCYAVSSLTADYAHNGSRINLVQDSLETAKQLSLEQSVRPDMPPVFIWHTAEDKSVPVFNSLALAAALKQKEIPFELHVFPDGRHGADLAENIAGTCQWTALFADWLKRMDFISE